MLLAGTLIEYCPANAAGLIGALDAERDSPTRGGTVGTALRSHEAQRNCRNGSGVATVLRRMDVRTDLTFLCYLSTITAAISASPTRSGSSVRPAAF